MSKSGLVISVSNPWLAASPDGVVSDPSETTQGLVEVKTPFSMKENTLEEACKTSSFCLERKNDEYQLKTRHDYFYQVQCQLYCTNTDWCDFILKNQ